MGAGDGLGDGAEGGVEGAFEGQAAFEDLVHEFRARRVEDQCLGLRRHLPERIDEQLAELLAKRRAARFAREDERNGRA